MRLPILAAALIACSAGVAMAAENSNPADKQSTDTATPGGSTANPNAKADSPMANPADKTKKDQGADSSGSTADPNAKPNEGTVPKSQNEGNPGAQK